MPVLAQQATSPEEGPKQTEQAAPQQPPSEPPKAAPAQHTAVQSKGDGYHENSAEYYSQRDITAQEGMAESTEKLVYLTERQNVITAIEAGLLTITIFFTAWAAIAASKAARSADAAVELTRETAERQLRAYVTVSGAEIKWIDESNVIRITTFITNTGQTPAYGVKNDVEINIGGIRTPENPANVIKENVDASIFDLGSGIHSPFYSFVRSIPMKYFIGTKDGTRPLYVIGDLTYQDIYRQTDHHTRYRLMLVGGESGRLVPCTEGNYSD